jgi:hypothetical protein
MKKLPVLIVLLVFGLSFVGASSAFGEAHKISDEYYYLVEPGHPNNTCWVEVRIRPNTMLKIVGGNCDRKKGPQPVPPGPISDLNLTAGEKKAPASLSSPGWIYIEGNSPGQYCYVNPVTGQYQCIYW